MRGKFTEGSVLDDREAQFTFRACEEGTQRGVVPDRIFADKAVLSNKRPLVCVR